MSGGTLAHDALVGRGALVHGGTLALDALVGKGALVHGVTLAHDALVGRYDWCLVVHWCMVHWCMHGMRYNSFNNM